MGQQYKNKTISNNDNDDNDYNDDNDDNDGGSEVSDVSVRGRYAARRDAPERSRLGALPCWTRHDTTVFEVSCWLWALSVHVTQMLCILRFCKACKKQQRHVSTYVSLHVSSFNRIIRARRCCNSARVICRDLCCLRGAGEWSNFRKGYVRPCACMIMYVLSG